MRGSLPRGMYRPTWADIDHEAFHHNFRVIAGLLPAGVRILAVVKADAYGHGAADLVRSAGGWGPRLWGFGVSSVEEGLALREAGCRRRILLLGSVFPFSAYGAVLRAGLTPTLAGRDSALALARWARRRRQPALCHMKIDTGMGRFGLSVDSAPAALADIQRDPWLRLEAVCTHLACAGSGPAVARQLKNFELACAGVSQVHRHAANSEAALSRPRSHYNMVRPGLALYGICPGRTPEGGESLKPVLSWTTRIVFIKQVAPGTPVSYGWTWRARRTSRIATLPVGYADGYRRSLSNRGVVLVRGRRCPVVGRVTMDQILVDVTDVGAVAVGEEAVLIGRQGRERLTAIDMARRAGTIPYEILCGISRRVPRLRRRG